MSHDENSVDGGEVIASDCKSEGQGFDSPSTLPKKIQDLEDRFEIYVKQMGEEFYALQQDAATRLNKLEDRVRVLEGDSLPIDPP